MTSNDKLPEGFIGTIDDNEDIVYNDGSEEDEDETQGLPSYDFSTDENVLVDYINKYEKLKSSCSMKEIIAQIRAEEHEKLVDTDGEEKTEKQENGKEPSDILKVKKRKINQISYSDSQINNGYTIDGQHLDYDASATFLQMNLSKPLIKAIASMNFVNPTPIQFATIPLALMGKDIYGCAATGTGKTAAFMLPVLERLLYKARGQKMTRVLVLLPTRELAVQVYQVSRQLSQFTKIEIALIVGGLPLKQQELALRQIPDIVIATPGRLIDHLGNTPSFSLHNIQILILDEADRILDEYFAEEMKEIIKQCAFSRQTMLFSATLTEKVEDLAATTLKNPVKIFLNSNTDVALNLQQEFIRIRPQREADREAILAALLTRTFQDHVMVFVQTRKQVHRLHVLLGLLGIKCAELHGDMNQPQRLEALRKFKEERVDVLIATDVAARGLDIVKVKTVINFTMPCSNQHYVHRVGRTARAGRGGRSVSLVGEKERALMKEIIKHAKNTVKSRQVPPEIVDKYNAKVGELEEELSRVMREEKEEKELETAEKKCKTVEELCTGVEERPRVWFQTIAEKKKQKQSLKLGENKKRKKGYKPTTEDRISVELQKAIDYQVRVAKRGQKSKKIRQMTEDNNNRGKRSKHWDFEKQKKSAFDEELGNTSKNSVKKFRYKATAHANMEKRMKLKSKKATNANKEDRVKFKTKACKKFKSKTRYRRKK